MEPRRVSAFAVGRNGQILIPPAQIKKSLQIAYVRRNRCNLRLCQVV
jgi:hypothetical protein